VCASVSVFRFDLWVCCLVLPVFVCVCVCVCVALPGWPLANQPLLMPLLFGSYVGYLQAVAEPRNSVCVCMCVYVCVCV